MRNPVASCCATFRLAQVLWVAVLLLVTGVVPAWAQMAPATNVGSVSAAQTVTVTITTGGEVGQINVLTQGAANKDYQLVSGGTCAVGTPYAVNATCTVEYSFTPSRPGQRLGAVSLTTGSDSTATVLGTAFLSGTGNGPLATFPGSSSISTLSNGFNTPFGVAVDGSGDVFVTDNNGLEELVAVNGVVTTGTALTTIAPSAGTSSAVAVDGSGNVFWGVPYGGANGITELVAVNGVVSSSSTKVAIGSGFNNPSGMAVDGSGDIFVADSGTNYVYEIVAVNGVVSSSSVVTPVGSGFSSPNSVTVDGNGNVFVTDNSSNVYEIVAVSGLVSSSSTVTTIGSGFGSPSGAVADAAGDVLVLDGGNVYEIVAVNGVVTSGSTVTTLASGFSYTPSMAVDGDGDVFIVDYYNNAVDEIDLTTPPGLNFAATAIGSTSSDSPQSVLVQNEGNTALTFSSLSVSSTDFTMSGTGTCSTSFTLPESGFCTVAASFTPQEAGTNLPGSLELTDNSSNAASPADTTQSVSLTGASSYTPPIVTDVSPAIGPIAGGTSVTITGTTLSGATAVSFGGTAATSFTVNSDTSITAVSPVAAGGTVDITVTIPAGSSATSAADQFSYVPLPPTVTLSDVSVAPGSTVPVTVTATETGIIGVVSGNVVTFSVASPATGSFLPATCTITAGTCSTTYIPTGTLATGPYQNDLTASFAATGNYEAGTATSSLNISNESTLLNFTGTAGVAPGTNPYYMNLVQGGDGNFYGTTEVGGVYGNGTVFRISPTGTYTLLHTFSEAGTEGASPYSGLIEGTDGNFYGTTVEGGANGNGTVYEISPVSPYTVTVLYSFSAAGTDGQYPEAPLVEGTDGNFYGATTYGGDNGNGTIFQLTSAGVFTRLYSFNSSGSDGTSPLGALVQGADGNFYGTTVSGGANGTGEIFQITSGGTLTTLHSFAADGSDGNQPYGTLVQGADGNFYGTTLQGGASGYGTTFNISPVSPYIFTPLHSFAFSDGLAPSAGLFLGSDGNFYGTTFSGGNFGGGTAYEMTSGGSITTLNSFGASATDGLYPYGGLVQGADGNFYGTTLNGGTGDVSNGGDGTVFKLLASPALNAPVTLSAPASVGAGSTFVLTYAVSNAYSATLQQCYATNTAGDTTGWMGVKTAAVSATNITLTASSSSGPDTYTLTCGGMESNSITITTTPVVAPASATVSAISVVAGSTVGVAVTATESGSDGVVTGGVVTFSDSSSSPGSFSPATCTLTSAGSCTTTYIPSGALASNTYANVIQASFAANNSYSAATASSTLTVSATSVFTGLTVTGLVSPAQNSVVQTVTVTAVDEYGNTLTNFTGMVALTSSDALATLPAAYTFQASDNGVHSFSMMFGTAGTQSVIATSGGVSGSETGISVSDVIVVTGSGGIQSQFTGNGTVLSGSGYSGGGTGTTGVAIDASGNSFSLNPGANVLVELNRNGTALSGTGYAGGGLSSPTALAMDGDGQVWIANGNGSLSVFSNAGAALTPSAGYASAGYSSPSSVAVDISGNVWVSNAGNNTVTEVLGGAAPVAPLSTAVQNETTGVKP